MLSPAVFKAYDVRGIVPDELDADGAYAPRARLRRRLRAGVMAIGHDMRLSSPELAAAAIRGASRGRRRRRRPGPDRHRDALLRGRRVRLRGRPPGHRLAQPGRLQRHEDRPPRRAPGGRRHRPRPDQAARRSATLPPPAGSAGRGRRSATSTPGFDDRVAGFIDPSAIRAAPGRAGRRQRHGRADDRAACSTGCRSHVVAYNLEPDGHFPNHEPNPLLEENRRFIIEQGARARAPTSASPGTATPTAASSSTTRASSCPAT